MTQFLDTLLWAASDLLVLALGTALLLFLTCLFVFLVVSPILIKEAIVDRREQ